MLTLLRNLLGISIFLASQASFAQSQARDTILIDFGSIASPAPYNNVSDAAAGVVQSLTNTDGESTGYGLMVTDSFNNINTGGTTMPDAATGFVSTATGDSFFGNTAVFGGATQPTGAIRLERLNPSIDYELTVFASRTGVTDNREAKYVMAGATRDSVALNASNNTSRAVTLTLRPAPDSSITITVSPGANNDNSSGFFYLGALRLTYDEQGGTTVVSTPADTLLIDFGTVLSPAPWNNITSLRADSLYQLIDEEGRSTTVTLKVVDPFPGYVSAGTRTPASSLGLPSSASSDGFFGNALPFGGLVDPTGAVELAGLDPNLEYSIQIFASRTATDNRETRYVLSGATVDSFFLDAASNDDRAVEARMRPSDAGTIRVMASAGPNNNNANGFFYLGAMRLASDRTRAGLDTVLVDFGDVNRQAPAPWNNITNPATGSIADLTNARGFATGYSIAVVDSFNNINTAGTTTPAPALGLSPEAAGDSFFGNTTVFGGQVQPTAAVEISNLDTSLTYGINLFASRIATDNRETQYIVIGRSIDTVTLDAASNTDRIASARMRPADDGTLRVNVSAGPNNTNSASFYYLGALVLVYPAQAPSGTRELLLLDPNGGEQLQSGKTFDIEWSSRNVGELIIDYSIDAGVSWLPIDTVAATSMSYAWTVPNVVTDDALVRIMSDSLRDISDFTFSITDDTTTCTIVVIGSSTAAGTGASSPDSSWVGRLRENLADDNTRYEVINLAQGGYTTFHLLPTGSTLGQSVNVPVDTARNITAALRRRPYLIIVNLPSNDVARFFTVQSQLRNFGIIDSVGRANGARVYFTTTQPRNFTNAAQIENQRIVRDSILAQYGEFAIDFYTPLARADGFIIDSLDSGDGVHVNDAGHRVLYQQVLDKQLDTVSCRPLISSVRERGHKAVAYGVKLYPNPLQGEQIYVDLGQFGNGEPIDIIWTNPLGQELLRQSAPNTQEGAVIAVERPDAIGVEQISFCRLLRRSDGAEVTLRVLVQQR